MQVISDNLDGAQGSARLERLADELDELKTELMSLEMDMVSQVEDTIKAFERNYTDMIAAFSEQVTALMSDVREAEEHWYKEMTDICVAFYEKLTKGEIENALDIPDDLMRLLQEKSTLTNAINAAHDGHLVAIDAKVGGGE